MLAAAAFHAPRVALFITITARLKRSPCLRSWPSWQAPAQSQAGLTTAPKVRDPRRAQINVEVDQISSTLDLIRLRGGYRREQSSLTTFTRDRLTLQAAGSNVGEGGKLLPQT